MSFKSCPPPDYDRYTPGQTFEGSLVYMSSPEKGLVYFINSEMFDEFNQIEEFQPVNSYKKPPNFGHTFIWYDKTRKSSYRAFRLNSSSADAQSIKSFLFDIGEIKYDKFSPTKYFVIPLNFQRLPPLGLCCVVENFPKPHGDCLKTEYFTESRIGKSFNITVQRKGVIVNSVGAEEKCMVVDIRDIDEELDDEPIEHLLEKPPPADVDHFRELTYLGGTAEKHVPFLYNQIPKIKDWPQPGSKIMVHLTAIGTRFVHAKCNTQNSFSDEKLVSEFMSLMMWMNQLEVVKMYQHFDIPPVKDEVVLVEEKNCRFFRAVIMNVLPGSFFQIFLFDLGKNMTIHQDKLIKFPQEFGTMPAQAIRLRISSLEKLSDELRMDAIATIHLYRNSIRMAHVIASSPEELFVKLYDCDGIEVMELMQMRLRNQLAEADNI